jgi:hypothetical protein
VPGEAVATGFGEARDHRRDRSVAVLATLLALAPVICVLLTRAGRHYLPLGDEAVIDMRVRDVFTAHTPLVGVYSRGFNHPGPFLYWLLAPLSAITGGAAWSIMVSGALLQGVAIAASAWLAFRRGGLLLCLGVLTTLAFAYSSFVFGAQFIQPWNPNIAFPFFMLFLLQTWSLAIGSRWQLLGVVVTGTLLVQLHVGYLPLVAAGIGWACSMVGLDHRRGRVPGSFLLQPAWRRVLTCSAVAAFVLWVVVPVQQLTQKPGNLAKLYRFFRDSGAAAGLRTGAGLFAAEFRFPPPWLGGSDRLAFFTEEAVTASRWWLLVPVALLALGFSAAHRTGRVADHRLLQLATLTAVVSILAMARVTVLLQPFVFYWRVISALFVVVAACWAVVGWIRLQDHALRYGPAVALVVVIAVFFGVRARDDVVDNNTAFNPTVAHAGHLIREVHRAGLPDRPVLIRGLGTTTYGLAQALFDDLDRSGVPVRVDPKYGYEYGTQRAADVSHVDQVWYVGASGYRMSILQKQPGGHLVAAVTPLNPHDERELRQLQSSLRAQLLAADRPDLVASLDSPLVGFVLSKANVPGLRQVDIDRLAQLDGEVDRAGRCRCFVVAYPRRSAPHLPSSMGY